MSRDDDVPEWVRARALAATDMSVAISDATLPDNPLIWVNPAFERVTGYSLEEAVGRNCRFLQGGDIDPGEVALVHDALVEGRAVTSTMLNHRKDGTAFWNDVTISPVHDDQGRLVNFVGVQVDVTRRVVVQQERARAKARVDFLAAVGAAVSALDESLALRQLATLLVGPLARGCLIAEVAGDVRVVAASGDVPPGVLGRRRRPARNPLEGDALGALVAGIVRDPAVLDVEAAREQGSWLTGWLARLLPAAGTVLALPIHGRRSVLGVVVLLEPSDDPDDLALLHEAVARAALAVENARLYSREHSLAETLQRSMLPGPVALPDLEVWAHYAPGTDLAQVGGDWYDVITRPDGSHGIVIGDVVGHDVEAAAVMGQLRSISRAYAYEIHDAATVLDRVDRLASSMQLPRLAGAVFVNLRKDGDGWEMTWANAGHLPPLVKRGDQVSPLKSGEGTLIGLTGGGRISHTDRLEPGDVLVLYTDGLVERRGRPMAEGLAALVASLAAAPPGPADELGRELLEREGKDPEDDLALLVLRVPGDRQDVQPAQRRNFSRTEHAPRQARAFAADWLGELGRPVPDAVLLVVSELVTDALRRGQPAVEVELTLTDGRVRVQVGDTAPGQAGGAEGLPIVERLADWGRLRVGSRGAIWAVVRP